MKRIFYFFLLTSYLGCSDNVNDCSQVVCSEMFKTFVVGADCCHVLLYEGETDIIVD